MTEDFRENYSEEVAGADSNSAENDILESTETCEKLNFGSRRPNLFRRGYDTEKGDFIIMPKNIFRYKDKNRKPLDDKIIGHFARLLWYSCGEWNLNQRGTATNSGVCVNTAGIRDKKLIEIGYLEKHEDRVQGKFNGNIYILNETLDKNFWKKDGLPPEIVNIITKNPNMNSSDMVNSNMENVNLCNNVSTCKKETKKRIDSTLYKENSNKFKSSKEVISSSLDTKINTTTSNTCNMNSCTHDTQPLVKDESFSINHDNSCNMQTCSSSNKHNYNGAENFGPTTKSKSGRKSKVDKLKEQFFPIIQEEADEELRDWLIKFFTVYIETKKYLNQITFDEMINSLEELSDSDVGLKILIVKTSVQKGWLSFQKPKEAETREYNKIKSAKKIKLEEEKKIDPELTRLATDEFGNLIGY